MLTGAAREQLNIILGFLTESDLRMIELKIVPGTTRSTSSAERIDAILSCAPQPSDILLLKSMRKSILRRYLWQMGMNVKKDASKSDYIQILLCMWEVENDDYLKKVHKKVANHQASNRLEPPTETKEVDNAKSQNQQEKKPQLDTITAIQQQCSDPTSSDKCLATASTSLDKYFATASTSSNKTLATASTSSDATLATASTSSPTKSRLHKEDTQQSPQKRKRESSPDEIIITMEKLLNSPVKTQKVENICVTPDISLDL